MSFVPLPIDAVSLDVAVIDEIHAEVHEAHTYYYSDALTIGSGSAQDYLITTPNTARWDHFTFEVDGTGITTITVFESADRSGVTAQTIINADRNSANVAGTTVYKGTSGGTTDGTVIFTYSSGTAGNLCNILLSWYEHISGAT